MADVRTLLVLRHAKSSWADPTLADHDRPLAPRGARAASRIAAHLLSEGVRPELVLCSSARRARDTLDALRPVLGKRADLRTERGLYGAGAEEIMERLRIVDPEAASVMIVGHNPGLHDLVTRLAGDGDEAAVRQLRTKFPTGALATLDLSSAWVGLAPGQAYLSRLVVPRLLSG
jgi:phosphohistidine phosphatase